jgi:hypothetical protein
VSLNVLCRKGSCVIDNLLPIAQSAVQARHGRAAKIPNEVLGKMSSVAAGGPPARNVRSCGPNDELLYTITDARGEPRLGAILWGLGVAEVKIARGLAKRGVASMQVRINGPEFYDDRRNEIYRRSGIDYCKLAMDKLATERGVTSFILMGTCACANIGFHAALTDSRVVGLILANPYVSTAQRVRTLGWDKFAKPGGWKRSWNAGAGHARAALSTVWRFVGGRFRSTTALPVKTAVSHTGERRAIELPGDFPREIGKLCDRGSKVLIACSTTDDSLPYLRKRHGSDLRKLEARGNLNFVEVQCSVHTFSTDDSAAALLNDAISRWIESTTFASSAAAASSRKLDLRFGIATPPAR